MEVDLRTRGRKTSNLRYSDDITLLAERKEGILEVIKGLKNRSDKAGLKLNLKKTRVRRAGQVRIFKRRKEISTVTVTHHQ
jgi:hypothetical protein